MVTLDDDEQIYELRLLARKSLRVTARGAL